VRVARYPSLRVRFVIEGKQFDVWALVDTGLDGHSVIAEKHLGSLPQPHRFEGARTANSEEVRVASYVGIVEVVDQPGPIVATIIARGREFLLGIYTLNHFRVTFDHGRRVTVEP
jgi:predicted aspartyl protease